MKFRQLTTMALILVTALTVVAAHRQQSVSHANKEQSRSLPLMQQVDYVDNAAREPMIVEHPNGTLFVSGYGASADQTAPRLWKSADHGISWQRVSVGTEAEGASANSDVDLSVAPDGTLYLVSMWFDLKTNEGAHIVVGTSPDGGNTWHWTMLSKKRFDDRPWVKVAGDGTAHVIWNDGSGVYHTMSRDRGITWSTPQKISPDGGSSHLAVAPMVRSLCGSHRCLRPATNSLRELTSLSSALMGA